MSRDEDFRRPGSDGVALLTPAAILLGSLFVAGAIVYAAQLPATGAGGGGGAGAGVVWVAPGRGGIGGPGPVQPSGIPVTRATPLKVGSKVLAPDGAWYRAEVLALNGEDGVRIRYTG